MGRIQNTIAIPIYRVLPYPVIKRSGVPNKLCAYSHIERQARNIVVQGSLAQACMSGPTMTAFFHVCSLLRGMCAEEVMNISTPGLVVLF